MPSPQYQRNQASLRALKHQCLFDFDFRRELLSRTRLSHRALKMKSSFLLTDGALAEWEASQKTPRSAEPGLFSNRYGRCRVLLAPASFPAFMVGVIIAAHDGVQERAQDGHTALD